MIILELSDIQLTKQANSAGLLRWQACRKIEVTQGPSRTGSFSHSTQLVNSEAYDVIELGRRENCTFLHIAKILAHILILSW